MEEGQGKRPLRAGTAAGGEREPGAAVLLGDVSRDVRAQEMEGQSAPLGVGEVAESVCHRLVGGSEDVREELDVVARPLDLLEEVAVVEQKSAGEVVRQIDLDQPPGFGMAGLSVTQGALDQPLAIEHQKPDAGGGLKFERFVGQRRPPAPAAALRMQAGADR